MRLLFGALVVLGSGSLALAGTREAESCLRAKVWEGYSDGWGVRTLTSTDLATGKTRNYVVNLFKGNQYKIQTCGDDHVVNLDVLLYDQAGTVLARDTSTDRQPVVEFTPTETGSYYVVLYARELDKPEAGVSMAVVYK
jgi:hypothetical protein